MSPICEALAVCCPLCQEHYSSSSPKPSVICPVVIPILLLMQIKHREVKKLAQDGTGGQVVELDVQPKYNWFLLFMVVKFYKVHFIVHILYKFMNNELSEYQTVAFRGNTGLGPTAALNVCVGWLKLFTALCMSANDHKRAMSIHCGVTNTF